MRGGILQRVTGSGRAGTRPSPNGCSGITGFTDESEERLARTMDIWTAYMLSRPSITESGLPVYSNGFAFTLPWER